LIGTANGYIGLTIKYDVSLNIKDMEQLIFKAREAGSKYCYISTYGKII